MLFAKQNNNNMNILNNNDNWTKISTKSSIKK